MERELPSGPEGSDAAWATSYFSAIGKRRLLGPREEAALSKAIRSGHAAEERLHSIPGPGAETERLRSVAENGVRARNELVESNLRLVVSVARRYRGRGLEFADLIQEGNLGLIRAAEKFDHRRGFRFSTYATRWIRKAVSSAVQEKSRTVRVPPHACETARRAEKLAQAAESASGEKPTLAEVAEALGTTPAKVLEARRFYHGVESLDRRVGDDGATLGELIAGGDAGTPDAAVGPRELSPATRRALDTLSERERQAVELRFGLRGEGPMTLGEAGAALGISRERVRQLQASAMEKMRPLLSGQDTVW